MKLAAVPVEPEALRHLHDVEAALRDLSPDELPEVLAEVERLSAIIWFRIVRPLPTEDRLITVPEAAAILSVSEDTIYRNAEKFPFVRHVVGSVRCSWLGVQKAIRNDLLTRKT